MKFKRHYQMTKGELNLAPLVDIIFQQIIYFMLTSSFIMQPGIKIKLPKASTSTETIQKQEIYVSISEEGIIFYNGQPVKLEELEEIFRQEKERRQKLTLVIKADENTKHGRVVQVMDTGRKQGIDKIAVATTPEL